MHGAPFEQRCEARLQFLSNMSGIPVLALGGKPKLTSIASGNRGRRRPWSPTMYPSWFLSLIACVTLVGAPQARTQSPSPPQAAPDPSPRKSPFLAARASVKLDPKARAALKAGAAWLVAHQSESGAWSAMDFSSRCGKLGKIACGGTGEALHDVGITGLCAMALLAAIEDPTKDAKLAHLARAADWLAAQQDPQSGLLGEKAGHSFLYSHAIATQALCELHRAGLLRQGTSVLEGAHRAICAAQNPGSGWRYDLPPSGDSDTSVTAWMVMALGQLKVCGVEVSEQSFAGAQKFLLSMVAPENGRIGYDQPGSLSSRQTRVNEHFPSESGEAMTAAGLIAGAELDLRLEKFGRGWSTQLALVAKCMPAPAPDAAPMDFYYVYWGAGALAVHEGKNLEPWNKRMLSAVVSSQCKDKEVDTLGSWTPNDAWGSIGGRPQTTALAMLALAAPLRYAELRSDIANLERTSKRSKPGSSK